jgi:NAD(P)-dependent dehydrogenase (short-subunit alcohol dehydrogenase family)
MARYSFLITGASSGLGLEIAIEALKQGHAVVAAARNPSAASEEHPEVQKLGGTWVELDVTRADTKETVARVVKEAGVNVLINCAGYGILGSLENTEYVSIPIPVIYYPHGFFFPGGAYVPWRCISDVIFSIYFSQTYA